MGSSLWGAIRTLDLFFAFVTPLASISMLGTFLIGVGLPVTIPRLLQGLF
jgi:hypothetical protein